MPVSILAMLHAIGICYAGRCVCMIIEYQDSNASCSTDNIGTGYRHSIFTAKNNGFVAAPSWLQVSRVSFPFYDIRR